MPEQKSSSRWVFWVLGGCLLIVVLGIAGVVGVYYWGRNKITTMVEEQTKPEVRERKAKEMLGATELPPGYHAGVNISMGLVKTARLSDKPITGDSAATYTERGFVYIDSIRTETSKIDDFLNGKSGNVIEEIGVRVRADESLGDGTMEVNGQKLRYALRRGEFTESNEAVPGLMTIVAIGCPDNRDRWAVWFQRVPPSTSTPDIPRAGSVADENAIREFFGHFHVCGA